MTQTKFWVIVALSASLFGGAHVRADFTAAQIQTQVEELILDRHPEEEAQRWLALGPAAPTVLIEMFSREAVSFRKLRILHGLGFFKNDPLALAFIKSQADLAKDDVLRNQALRVIAFQQGEKEEEFLGGYLTHPDPQTRRVVARAFQGFKSESSQKKYKAYLSQEKVDWLKKELLSQKRETHPERVIVTQALDEAFPKKLEGNWKGYWISLKGKPEASSVKFSLQRITAQEISGELEFTQTPLLSKRVFTLTQVEGRSTRFKGVLVEKNQGTRLSLEGTFAEEGGNLTLELRLPYASSWILLKR
jgi:hypothetical protein